MAKKHKPTRWRKLDNTAILFPIVANRQSSNVFRLTAVLQDAIQPALLQTALEETLPRFAAFHVRLRYGLFWNYFETNPATPVVRREEDAPCQYIDALETNRFLFRVLYYKNRVHLETFHALTDGTGALRFLKAICYRYCQLVYSLLGDTIYGLEEADNVEDCYLKYYRPMKQQSFKNPDAHQLHGERRMLGDLGVLTAKISLQELKAECKRWDVSIGVYLSAAILLAIREEYMGANGARKPATLFVPVDLRRIFHCETSLNFFSCITISKVFDAKKVPFEEIIALVKKEFEEKLTRQNFEEKLAYTARGETNLFTRIAPLPLKNGILRIIFEQSNKGSSISFSNLGPISVEPAFAKYFKEFRVMLSPSPREPIKCSACAYDGIVALSFVSLLEKDHIARNVIQRMSKAGVPIIIESNGDKDEAL